MDDEYYSEESNSQVDRTSSANINLNRVASTPSSSEEFLSNENSPDQTTTNSCI